MFAQVDRSGQPCPDGAFGRIRIAGVQVGRGYLGGKQDEWVGGELPDDPVFSKTLSGERCFITNDRGFVGEGGKIRFAGREDGNVVRLFDVPGCALMECWR